MNFIKNFWQKRKKMILWATGIGCVLGLIFGLWIIYFAVCDHPLEYYDELEKLRIKYTLIHFLFVSGFFILRITFILNIIFFIILKIYEIIKNLLKRR